MSFLNDDNLQDESDVQSVIIGYIRQLLGNDSKLSMMGTGDNGDPFCPYILYRVLYGIDKSEASRPNNIAYTGYLMLYDDRLALDISGGSKFEKNLKHPSKIKLRIEFADPNSFDKLEEFLKRL